MSFKIGTIESNLSSKNFIPDAPIQIDPVVVILHSQTKEGAKQAFTRMINDFKDYFGFYDEVLSAHYKAIYESNDLTEIQFVTSSVVDIYLPEFIGLAKSNKNIGYCKYMSIKKLNDYYNSQGVLPVVTTLPGAALEGLGSFWSGVWKFIKPALIIAAGIVATVLTSGLLLPEAISWGTATVGALIATGLGLASSFIQDPNQNIGDAFNNALPNFFGTMVSVAQTGNVSLKGLSGAGNADINKVYDFIQENSDSLSTEYLADTDFKKEQSSFLPLLVAGAGVFALVN